MIQRPLFVFCLIFIFAGLSSAQRSITNSDLEKYKQSRLQADKDYRENYQRLGLPSPEELERRRDASRLESAQLYDKLRAERLEAEKLRAIQAAANAQLSSSSPQFIPYGIPYNDPGYVFYSVGRFSRLNRGRGIGQGYFAGGQFWPTGPRTALRPMLRIGPSGRSGIHRGRR
jgi:hypothetical protein